MNLRKDIENLVEKLDEKIKTISLQISIKANNRENSQTDQAELWAITWAKGEIEIILKNNEVEK